MQQIDASHTSLPTTSPVSPFSANYAQLSEMGLLVLPVEPNEKRPHSSLGRKWQRFAESPPIDDQLEAWAKWPGAGIGLLMGEASGVIGIDVDTDDKAALAAINSALPSSPVKKVGARGFTAFYKHNGERSHKIGCIDLLSDKKFCILPPSIHPKTKKPYMWMTDDTLFDFDREALPALTGGDLAKLEAVMVELGYQTSDMGSGLPVGEIQPDLEASADELDDLRAALLHLDADDYHRWADVGNALRSLGGVGMALWHDWACTSDKYDASEAQQKWQTFKHVEKGLTYPSVFKWAREAGWQGPLLPDYHARLMQGLRDRQAANDAAAVPNQGFRWLRASELGEIKAPDWLIDGVIGIDSLAMLFAPPAAGKTFVAMSMGICIAANQEWLGRSVNAGPVLYICGEGMSGINRRIQAACKHQGVSAGEIPFYVSSQPVPFLDSLQVRAMMEATLALPVRPAMIIVDTLNRNFGDGDENTTKDMTRFVEAIGALQNLTKACVMVVHHTGLVDESRSRGNSSLKGAIDTEMSVKQSKGELILNCTKQKDAEQFDPIGLKLTQLLLGVDASGNNITSCAVTPSDSDIGALMALQLKASMPESNRSLLALIPDTGIDYGRLRSSFIEQRQKENGANNDAARKAFNRSYDGLIKDGAIQASSEPDVPNLVIKT